MMLSSAPDEPVNSISIEDVRDTSISVSWDSIECLSRNSEINGYRVMFALTSSYQDEREQSEIITNNQYLLGDLQPNQSYTLQVYPVISDIEGPPIVSWMLSVRTQVSC